MTLFYLQKYCFYVYVSSDQEKINILTFPKEIQRVQGVPPIHERLAVAHGPQARWDCRSIAEINIVYKTGVEKKRKSFKERQEKNKKNKQKIKEKS